MALVLLDAAGHRGSPATMPCYHHGRAPRNKGASLPGRPANDQEIVAVMRGRRRGGRGSSAGADRHSSLKTGASDLSFSWLAYPKFLGLTDGRSSASVADGPCSARKAGEPPRRSKQPLRACHGSPKESVGLSVPGVRRASWVACRWPESGWCW